LVNVTIALDDEVLERASAKAEEQGLSLDALLRDYLEVFAGVRASREEAVRTLLSLSVKAESGSGGRLWTRDELHER
jgi:hypothetical protein